MRFAIGLVFVCLSVCASQSAEVGSLDPAGRRGIGIAAERAQFAIEAFVSGGAYRDRGPGRPLVALDGALDVVPVGGFGRSQWRLAGPFTDHWSARWTGTLRIEKEGDYTFFYTTDDGARMWIDDQQIVDDWVPRSGLTSEAKVNLTAGEHAVRVEFFEQGGSAQAHLEWAGPDIERQVVPAAAVSSDGEPGWKAEYFDDRDLRGEPKTGRAEAIHFNWGEGGPGEGGEPPIGRLDWARLSDAAVVMQLSGPSPTRLGIVVQSAGPEPFQFRGEGQGLAAVAKADTDAEQVAFRLIPLTEGAVAQVSNPAEPASVWAPAKAPAVFLAGCGELPSLTAEAAVERLREAMLTGMNAPFPEVGEDGSASLLNGRDLTGWHLRHAEGRQSWSVQDGALANDGTGTDLFSEVRLTDFELHVEFSVPQGSNSGVYLQGRYEIQICDSAAATDLNWGMCGGIYGKATPSENAAKPAGEWQTFDVTFRGARPSPDGGLAQRAKVTVLHNDKKIIDDVELDGITGGAMDGDEWRAHGLMVQGDHGPVQYRNIKVKPLQ